jgi:thiol-disulfide isomerase/thioredoxin
MKQQHVAWLLGGTTVLTLASIGFLGYRLYSFNQQPSQAALEAQARLSRQASPEAAQAQADALLAMTLPDLDGRLQPLSQWRGKVLVINYWASWCTPCVEEMPLLSRLNTKYADRGVQFIGIGLDEIAKMAAFVKTTSVSYPLLVGGINPAGQSGLTVKGLPFTLVLNSGGKVEFSQYGRVDDAMLEPVLQRLTATK